MISSRSPDPDLKYTTYSQFYTLCADEASTRQLAKEEDVLMSAKVKQWVTYRYRPRIIKLTSKVLIIKALDDKSGKEEEIPIFALNVIDKTNKK